MNDFTKDELQVLLMSMKPFYFLWQKYPLKLEEKLQSLIDNYCEHEESEDSLEYEVERCKKCGEIFVA